MCIMVTHICSAATVNESFLILHSIKYLGQQMFSVLDNFLKVGALASLFKEDVRWCVQSCAYERIVLSR